MTTANGRVLRRESTVGTPLSRYMMSAAVYGIVVGVLMTPLQSKSGEPSSIPEPTLGVTAPQGGLGDSETFRFLSISAPISIDELRSLAWTAVPKAEARVGRVEEYAVLEGTVLSSVLVDRPDVRPRLVPYASYSIAVKRVIGIGTVIEPTEVLDVVAMWPPMYSNGGVGGTYWSHPRDPRIPLSIGLRTLAIGFRDPNGRGGPIYRSALWPSFHVMFAVVAHDTGEWYVIMPDPGRQYDVDTARRMSRDGLVHLQAWHGVARPIQASTDDLYQLFQEVATEASEQ